MTSQWEEAAGRTAAKLLHFIDVHLQPSFNYQLMDQVQHLIATYVGGTSTNSHRVPLQDT